MTRLLCYSPIHYNGKDYIVGTVQYKEEDANFLFDKEDFTKIEERPWHVISGKYIGTRIEKKEVSLHAFLHPTDETHTVEHINHNGFDNRKENIRIVTRSQKNIHQATKERTVILPLNCGLKPAEFPKHIWYIQPNGQHGDRFAIEFKTENLIWKSTSSKRVTLQEKLSEAKVKLESFYREFPYLDPSVEEAKVKALTASYEAILRLHLDG